MVRGTRGARSRILARIARNMGVVVGLGGKGGLYQGGRGLRIMRAFQHAGEDWFRSPVWRASFARFAFGGGGE